MSVLDRRVRDIMETEDVTARPELPITDVPRLAGLVTSMRVMAALAEAAEE